MTLNKAQLTVTRLVVLLVCLGILAWMWRRLEQSRRPPTTAMWVEKLRSGDPDDRRYAIQELSSASVDDAPSVVVALTEALKDKQPSVRNDAVLALGAYLARAIKERGSAATEQSRAGATALLELIKNDGDSSVRDSAAFAMASLARALAGAGIKPDRGRAEDPLDPKIMARAFDSILERDPASRLAILVPYESLGEIGGPAPPALLAALDDQSPDVRKLALQVLCQFTSGSDQAVPVLLKDAELKPPPSGIQAVKGSEPGSALARAARGLHPTGAVVPILAKAIESQNPDVRRAAVILLDRVGPDARSTGPALLEAAKKLMRTEGGDDKAKHEGPEYSDFASAIAHILPPDEAITLLTPALESDRRAIRTAAATALGKIGPKGRTAVPILLKSLKVAKNPAVGRPDSAFTGAILESLGQIVPEASLPKPEVDEVIDAIAAYLGSSQNFLRITAAKTLGQFGPKAKGMLPKLRDLSGDEKAAAAAKEAASEAIAKIEPATEQEQQK